MKSYETESRQTPDRETTRVEETAVATSSQVEEQAVAEAEVIDAPPYAEYNKQALDVPEKRTTQSIAHLRFTRPTREQLLHWLPFFAVVLLGAILRFWGLGEKPLHHDESLHAYFSLQLMHNMENWLGCFNPNSSCYHYDPLLHGPFQFHAIALVYKISQLLGVYDHGVNTTTVRIAAATLGTVIVALPFFLQDYLGRSGAWLACFLLAISPSMVYFSRFAREDIYMACFTLLLVVAIARYAHTRRMRWLVTAAAAFSLSYATKEATFLTIAVFGSFFGALVAWEIGATIPFGKRREGEARLAHKVLPRTGTNTGEIRGPQGTHKGCPYNGTDRPVMRVRTIAGTSLVDALRTLISLVLRTWAPVTLLLYFVIIAPIAKLFFGWMKDLSIYITDPRNTNAANVFVESLK
ncbi:MAG: TIGR03663 family protein, partial [Chloroflexi bacterium]